MRFKAFARLDIAVIGEGRIADNLIKGLLLTGHHIYAGSVTTDPSAAESSAYNSDSVFHTSIDHAAALADLIIMTTAPEEVREAAYLLDDVRKKVILDATYMNCNSTGQYLNTLNAIRSITGAQHLVKCFNASGFAPFVPDKDNAIHMFVAGDDRKAKEMARLIARDIGYTECHDFGGSDTAVLLDEMAICYHNLALHSGQGTPIAIRITKG